MFSYRLSQLALALLIPGALGAQNLAQPVDYTTRAKPLRIVLADLSSETHTQLSCSPEIAEEPLILRLKGVRLQEAMDKIGEVFGGKWAKQGKGYSLGYGEEANARHEARRALLIEAAKKAVDKQMANLMPPKQWDRETVVTMLKDWEKADTANALARTMFNLSARQVLQIFEKIDPKEICDLPQGAHVVYATDPTPFQRPLPDVGTELQALAASENLYFDAVTASDIKEPFKGLLLRDHPRLEPPFGKLILNVESEGPSVFYVNLELFDGSGNRIGQYGARAGENFDFATHRKAEQAVRDKFKIGVGLGPAAEEIAPFELSPDHRGLRPVSEETRQLILSPTTTDPLALATSDLALGLGDQMDLNVVFLPTDWGEIWAYIACRGSKTNLELLQKVLERTSDTRLGVEDHWLVGMPVDPLDALRKRIPRPGLERYLKSVTDAGYLTIDALADFALEIGPERDLTPMGFILAPLDMKGQVWFYSPAEWAKYAFYGSLTTEQQRKAAGDLLRVDKTSLTTQQLDLLDTWILNSRGDLTKGEAQYVAKSAIKDPLPALLTVRSQALEEGLGNGAYLEVTDRSEPRFHIPRVDNPLWDDPMTIEELARTVALSESEKTEDGRPMYDQSSVWSSTYRTVHVRLVLPSGYGDKYDLNDDRSNQKGNLADLLKSLPSDLRKRYNEALDKARPAPDQAPPDTSGAAGRPPR